MLRCTLCAGRRMGRRVRCLVPLAVVLLLLALAAAVAGLRPATAGANLSSTIDGILARHGVAGGGTGVCVRDFDTGRLIYARHATTPLAPASNMKLVTAATALKTWGAEFRFTTELFGPDVPIYGGVIYGDLHLKGYGDPSLSTLGYQRHELHFATASFEKFAQRLRALGVRKIEGRVLGDESWFDKQRFMAAWKPDLRLECGPLAALSGDEGLDDGNRVASPAVYAARLCTNALRKARIKVTGAPGTGKVPATASLIRRQYSARLGAVIKHMDKESDNFFAEMLVKGLGKDIYGKGSTAAGVKVLQSTLRASGMTPARYRVQDGCGLSYGDRLTAEGVVSLLGDMWLRPEFRPYYDSLAIAGVDGTLDERMRGTAAAGNAHAKTGTLDIAVCLSGYVESADKHRVAFSILVNGGSVSWGEATAAQDAIVVALAKASLPGSRQSPFILSLRHFPVSAMETVHAVGGVF